MLSSFCFFNNLVIRAILSLDERPENFFGWIKVLATNELKFKGAVLSLMKFRSGKFFVNDFRVCMLISQGLYEILDDLGKRSVFRKSLKAISSGELMIFISICF